MLQRFITYLRRFGYAIMVAYLLAWHNVYNHKMDSRETIQFHQEHDFQVDNSDTLHDQWYDTFNKINKT